MSVAVITGASGGIGREFALKLSALPEIDEVWLIARNTARLEELASKLNVRSRVITADLSVSEGIESYRAALNEYKPEIKFLVNAAGFGVFGSFDMLSEKTVSDMI